MKSVDNFKIMSEEAIMAAVNEVKNGQFVRLGYRTEPTMKAEFRKAGYKVIKLSECTGRLGCDYENLKSTKEARAAGAEKSDKTNNYYWIVDNKIAGNTKTGKKYIRMTTTPGSNTKSEFYVFDANGDDVSDTMNYKDLVVPSYFKPSGAPMEPVRNIKLENITRINDKGVTFEKAQITQWNTKKEDK